MSGVGDIEVTWVTRISVMQAAFSSIVIFHIVWVIYSDYKQKAGIEG